MVNNLRNMRELTAHNLYRDLATVIRMSIDMGRQVLF
jgi:hypothetical protein